MVGPGLIIHIMLENQNFTGTGPFVTQAGSLLSNGAGSAAISGIGDIGSVVIQANPNEAMAIDNLSFTTASP